MYVEMRIFQVQHSWGHNLVYFILLIYTHGIRFCGGVRGEVLFSDKTSVLFDTGEYHESVGLVFTWVLQAQA